jgi:glycosyltransferase involved in cell wall biosynthesis
MKALRPDVVHTHLHVLRYALPSMLSFPRAAKVHTVHNLAEREAEAGTRWIQRYAFNHGVVPVAVSDEVAISLERVYGITRCRTIANCIPTKIYASPQTPRREWRAREGFADDDVLFVCVARFAPQKNHALLLDSFAQGPISDPKAHLVLVGEGALQGQLQMQARNLGLSGQIHFLGLRADIPDILGAMDVFVLSSDYEGSPLSVIEAMASGLPVVSTAAGGVPDLFESGREGFLVPLGNMKSLSGALDLLLSDSDTRKFMGIAAARRAKRNFDVTTMVRAYEELYESAMAHLRGQCDTFPASFKTAEEEFVRRGDRWEN